MTYGGKEKIITIEGGWAAFLTIYMPPLNLYSGAQRATQRHVEAIRIAYHQGQAIQFLFTF